jgi:2-keto-4-pentenoate hydratase/2-oxohepta-3-ene-1,7-dioic acid hydratase in catechol pathway
LGDARHEKPVTWLSADMKFATYEHRDMTRAGLVVGDLIHPLTDAVTLRSLIEDGSLLDAGAAALSRPPVPIVDVRLLPPLQPASIRDFVAFEAHIEGVVKSQEGLAQVPEAWYEAPAFYFTNPHAAHGAHDDVAIFPGAEVFDFEIEVGAVIGISGRDLPPEQARDHIVGYTIFNDWSARDLQRREARLPFGFAKGKDGAHTLGPWLVTADELERFRTDDGFLDLTMTVELNGELIGRDSLANASWPFEELISYASRGAWVRPGDVIGSGTCAGGCLAELWGRRGKQDPPPLSPGDIVTMTVEGIGTISNTVIAGAPPLPLPPARTRPRGSRH